MLESLIMVWIETQGIRAAVDDEVERITLADQRYTYSIIREFQVLENSWCYNRFVSDAPIRHGVIPLDEFVQYLIDKGVVNPDYYVANIEFGTETVSGSGRMVVNTYEIR